MKRSMTTILITTLAVLLAGCGDDNPADPGGGGGGGGGGGTDDTISFTIGTQNRSYTDAVGAYSASNQTLNVSAFDNPVQETATVVCPRQLGTVTMSADDVYGFNIIIEGVLFISGNGVSSINVTSLSGSHVEGMFAGTVTSLQGEERVVTNGAFESDFVEIP